MDMMLCLAILGIGYDGVAKLCLSEGHLLHKLVLSFQTHINE